MNVVNLFKIVFIPIQFRSAEQAKHEEEGNEPDSNPIERIKLPKVQGGADADKEVQRKRDTVRQVYY